MLCCLHAMPWCNKETATRFDNQPIEGLFFLDGDMVARMKQAPYAKGMKYPGIAFPSGAGREIYGDSEIFVNIFASLDLPLYETRDEAYITAREWNEGGYYTVLKRGENELELRDHETESIYLVTYSEEPGRIVDIALLY